MSKAPRYPRSFGGLVGAMIVLVLAVLAFVIFRGIFREPPPADLVGGAIDFKPSVTEIQTVATIAWPRDLPDDWRVTSADWDRADPDRPMWRLGVLTSDSGFVGLYQQDAPAEDLVHDAIGEDAVEDDTVSVDAQVATDWTRWAADDGDVAFSTTLKPPASRPGGETTLVVYGTDQGEVSTFLTSLTTDLLPSR